MSNLKEPLPIFIETGYMLTELAQDVEKRTQRIIEHIREGVSQARARGDSVLDIETAEIFRLLFALISAGHGAKHAHKICSDLLAEKGYRQITVQDWLHYGVKGR